MSGPVRFLFVDDDEQILRALGRILQREGFELHFSADPKAAEAIIAERSIEVLVCDHMMPGLTGVQLLATVGARFPRVLRVLASGSQDRSSDIARESGAHRFIDKPWLADELRRTLHELASDAIKKREA